MEILASWELGLGYGHIATLAPACRALRARGHRVTLAARTLETVRRLEVGAFDRLVKSPRYRGPVPPGETLTYGQVIAAGGMADPANAIELTRTWLRLFDRLGPAALIAEHAPISLLAAHVAGLPAVRLGSGFIAPSARNAGASLLPWSAHSETALAGARAPADAVVRAVCRHFGAAERSGLAELLEGAPEHALAWPELDYHGPGATDLYYGPLIGIDAHDRPDWPYGAGPRTLVYLPFDRPASVVVAHALGGLRWPVLWHSSSPPPPGLPDNIRYCDKPIDLMAIGRQAALYVGRGGYGASASMLRAGIPQLLLPDRLESLLLTYRLCRAGVARSQAASSGVQAAGEALARVARSEEIRTTAAAVAAAYAGFSPGASIELLVDDLMAKLGA
jgi:UDP:flavonoid glycosyltransferase YjiC (YdhE family)